VVTGQNPFLVALASQLPSLDWFNERAFEPILDDLWKLVGPMGLVQIEYLLCMEQKKMTLEFVKSASNCDVALTQLNLPLGVVWGSANWVDSVREARRKYPYDQLESDLKSLVRIGSTQLARSRIHFRLAKEAQKDAPLLTGTVRALLIPASVRRAQNSAVTGGGDQRPDHVLSMALGLDSLPPSVHYDVLDELSTARRVFILLNELAKRIVTNGTQSVFGSTDYYYCCAGVATFSHSQSFVQELDRCVFADARALCLKSLLERQNAESSVLFKFGAQKVAKVALERLVQEQAIHRVTAQLGGRRNDAGRAPVFMERIAEAWTHGS